MKLSKFWVVRNPSPVSALTDICWETDANMFADYVLGSRGEFKRENTTLYTEKEEAMVDAHERLDKIRRMT